MKRQDQHVVPHDTGWAVLKESGKRPSGVFSNKEGAEARAREIVMNSGGHVVLHRKDGSIEEVLTPQKAQMAPKSGLKPAVHIAPHQSQWEVRRQDREKAGRLFKTKYGAIRHGHTLADRHDSPMIVHNRDGTISHVDTAPHYPSAIGDLMHLR